MNTRELALAAAGAATVPANAQTGNAVGDLIARLRSKNDNVRGDAWQQAGPFGAAAVGPVSALWTDVDFETARSAKRAVWNIVHYAGRPGADNEARLVEAALLPLLARSEPAVRREAAWMLSEIGGDDSVSALAALLNDRDVRDDARCALERLPGTKAIGALRAAMETVPEDFRYAVAESLRRRGEQVEGYPSRKLMPAKS